MPPKYFKKKTILGSRTHFTYNPHTKKAVVDPSEEQCKSLGGKAANYRAFVTIDPGQTNFGVYMEAVWSNGEGQYLAHELFHPLESETNDYPAIIAGCSRVFEELYPALLETHYIVVESQVDKNLAAMAMERHFISLCYERLRDTGFRPLIIEINPSMKTKLLDAPTGLSRYQIKKWCIEKAIDILSERGEEDVAHELFIRRRKPGEGKNKKDDICDGVCMVRAIVIIFEEIEKNREWVAFLE
jgi:hypothetical protein